MKTCRVLLFVLLSVVTFAVWGNTKPLENSIKVGTIDGPETRLMEVAAQVALKRYGLVVHIVAFSDYNTPNAALNDGSIDADMFQHLPFLQQQIISRGYKLAVVGKTYIYPMGIYSKKIRNLQQVPSNAIVAIPNDPSNEARALLLLQSAHLFTLKPGFTVNATTVDVQDNPKHLRLIELEAPQLPRSLQDVTLAVINTNFAVASGLSPTKDALFHEGADSPYANLVVVRANQVNDPRFKQLVEALHSAEVQQEAKKLFGDAVIPAF